MLSFAVIIVKDEGTNFNLNLYVHTYDKEDFNSGSTCTCMISSSDIHFFVP